MPAVCGQATTHPVAVEAQPLERPIIPGFGFAFVTLPTLNCPAIVETTTGIIVGWGETRYKARQDAEIRLWGKQPTDFQTMLGQYPALNPA